MDDVSVLQDLLKLTLSFLDRTTHQIRSLERKKIKSMLRCVVPTFFMIDEDVFNQAFVVVIVPSAADNADSNMSDKIPNVASSILHAGNRSRKSGVASGRGGDLRQKLLKSEQAKSLLVVKPERRKRLRRLGLGRQHQLFQMWPWGLMVLRRVSRVQHWQVTYYIRLPRYLPMLDACVFGAHFILTGGVFPSISLQDDVVHNGVNPSVHPTRLGVPAANQVFKFAVNF